MNGRNFLLNGGAQVLLRYGEEVVRGGRTEEESKVAAVLAGLLGSHVAKEWFGHVRGVVMFLVKFF